MGELAKADWYTPKGSYMPDQPPWTENKDKRWRQLMGLQPGGTGAVPAGEKRPPETYNAVGHGWVDSKADGFQLQPRLALRSDQPAARSPALKPSTMKTGCWKKPQALRFDLG